MNTIKKIAILSLLAVALFVPQESKAVNWKQWLAIGAGVTFVGVVGYQIYESINAPQQDDKSDDESDDENGFKFNLEEYNNANKKSEIKGIFSSKETFTAKEYAEKIKELIESNKHYPWMVDNLFMIVKKKGLMSDVLKQTFIKENEEVTLLQFSQGTWAQTIIDKEYDNFIKKSLSHKKNNN